jgi:hypothetical protein
LRGRDEGEIIRKNTAMKNSLYRSVARLWDFYEARLNESREINRRAAPFLADRGNLAIGRSSHQAAMGVRKDAFECNLFGD